MVDMQNILYDELVKFQFHEKKEIHDQIKDRFMENAKAYFKYLYRIINFIKNYLI